MADYTALITRLKTGAAMTLHQLNYRDLVDAIAVIGRATVDASPGEASSCYYCIAGAGEPHQVSCPVPVAEALLRHNLCRSRDDRAAGGFADMDGGVRRRGRRMQFGRRHRVCPAQRQYADAAHPHLVSFPDPLK